MCEQLKAALKQREKASDETTLGMIQELEAIGKLEMEKTPPKE